MEKQYEGMLSRVVGTAAANIWHLYVSDFYWGTLSYKDKWEFHNQRNDMHELAEFFGAIIEKAK